MRALVRSMHQACAIAIDEWAWFNQLSSAWGAMVAPAATLSTPLYYLPHIGAKHSTVTDNLKVRTIRVKDRQIKSSLSRLQYSLTCSVSPAQQFQYTRHPIPSLKVYTFRNVEIATITRVSPNFNCSPTDQPQLPRSRLTHTPGVSLVS